MKKKVAGSAICSLLTQIANVYSLFDSPIITFSKDFFTKNEIQRLKFYADSEDPFVTFLFLAMLELSFEEYEELAERGLLEGSWLMLADDNEVKREAVALMNNLYKSFEQSGDSTTRTAFDKAFVIISDLFGLSYVPKTPVISSKKERLEIFKPIIGSISFILAGKGYDLTIINESNNSKGSKKNNSSNNSLQTENHNNAQFKIQATELKDFKISVNGKPVK